MRTIVTILANRTVVLAENALASRATKGQKIELVAIRMRAVCANPQQVWCVSVHSCDSHFQTDLYKNLGRN